MSPDSPADTSSAQPPPSVPAGWYPDPEGSGQRWWDGRMWGVPAVVPSPQPTAYPHQIVVMPAAEKSSGLGLLFTILFPGAGHMYLGLTQKATPFVVANAIGLVCALTIFLLPVSFLIWLVTMCMTVGSITQDTEFVNAARREGRRVSG